MAWRPGADSRKARCCKEMRRQPQGRNVSEIFGENRSSEEGSRIPACGGYPNLLPQGHLNKTPLVVNDH